MSVYASGRVVFPVSLSLSCYVSSLLQLLIAIDLKHKYWYMNIPDYGIIPTPVALFTPEDFKLARALAMIVTGQHTFLFLCNLQRVADSLYQWLSGYRSH